MSSSWLAVGVVYWTGQAAFATINIGGYDSRLRGEFVDCIYNLVEEAF